MKAIVLHQYGGADNLRYEDFPTPQPGTGEVLVKVKATSLNPIDWKVRSGAMQTYMPLQLPDILGRDLAGEVTEIGGGVTQFKKGDRVMGLTKKTYAEFCVAKVEELALIPDGMDFEQAAAVPLVTLTGTQLIEKAVGIRSGQTVLITGALGSVGRTAVFVAKRHGAKLLAGVRESQKKEAEELGADGIVALDNDQEISKLHDLDAIADTVGGQTIAKLLGTLRKGGTIGSVLGPVKGAEEAGIQVKPMSAVPDSNRLSELAADVARGDLKIPISKILPLKEAAEAQKLAEKGGTGGKILLIP
jgi:NADPH:quinone reductase-like Zn-dependent oxidoreductase